MPVWIGGFGAFAASCAAFITLLDIKRLSEAALYSAKSSVDAARPWMVIQFTLTEGPPERPIFKISAINQGKTPALITKVSAAVEAFTDPLSPSLTTVKLDSLDLPDQPLIVKKDSFPIWEQITLSNIRLSGADFS
ncbi:hypothetical protein [Tunturiibacter psychrotolerans]|uniref:hypothetical protein n=1 Tax=Tunturiibacter psychrotolerans TaxID=3069686 RepID=UPI003D23F7FC